MNSFLLSTQLGPVVVDFQSVERYDVESIIRDRAYSQAMSVKMLAQGKNLNPNNQYGARTLASAYAFSDEELPE